MPLYEYKCNTCGDVFEVLQKFSDKPLKIHENCGGTLERLISPAALQFKGSGWYVTDYGGKSNGKGGASHKAKAESEATKPAAKPETSTSSGSEASKH